MFTLKIDTGNAAFQDTPAYEVARILRELADRMQERGFENYPLRDANGNTVGTATLSGE